MIIIALILIVELTRQVLIQATITLNTCEGTIFWLSRWEEGRSVLHLLAAVFASIVGLWAVWCLRSGQTVLKLIVATCLLLWFVALEAQLETYLPHRAERISERFAQPNVTVADPHWYWSGIDPRFVQTERVRDDALASSIRADQFGGWRADYIGAAYAADDRTVTYYYGIDRFAWLFGGEAPYAWQMNAARQCTTFNERMEAAYDEALAKGASPFPPDLPVSTYASGYVTGTVLVPPVVMDPTPYSVIYD